MLSSKSIESQMRWKLESLACVRISAAISLVKFWGEVEEDSVMSHNTNGNDEEMKPTKVDPKPCKWKQVMTLEMNLNPIKGSQCSDKLISWVQPMIETLRTTQAANDWPAWPKNLSANRLKPYGKTTNFSLFIVVWSDCDPIRSHWRQSSSSSKVEWVSCYKKLAVSVPNESFCYEIFI